MLGRLRRLPRLIRVALLAGTAVVALVAALNLYVVLSQDGGATSDVAKEPHAQVALVLGAGLGRGGGLSEMLADRIKATVALWRAGKVDRILVSGDHHTWGYDEPDAMRRVLQRDGVPGRDIFTDHAGLDTWASMVRARKVFDVHTAIVITQ